MSSTKKRASLLLLASMSALGQFANCITFPAFPLIATTMKVPAATIQLLLAIFLGGFAISLLVFGPFSDRIGRKPVAFACLAIFGSGCIVAAFTTKISMLFLGRILQAVGSAGPMAVSRAMARDYYEVKALAKAAAIMTIMYAAAPGLSPLLGSVLQPLGWQAGFWISFALGLIILFGLLTVEESLPFPTPLSLPKVITSYRSLFRSPRFVLYSVTSGFAMGGLFAYQGAAPFLFQKTFGITATRYGIYPALAILGFVVGSMLVKWKVDRSSSAALTFRGLIILVSSALLLLALSYFGAASSLSFTFGMFFYVIGLGIIFPLSMAELLKDFPRMAAAAAGVGGFIQMFGGAVGATVTSRFNANSLFAIPLTMLALSLFGIFFFLWFQLRLRGNVAQTKNQNLQTPTFNQLDV